MQTLTRVLGASLAATIAAVVVSCEKKSTPTSPPPGPGDNIVSLRLTAPARINPGESAQLTAEAIKGDGSAENVSGQASWSSSNASSYK